MRLRLHIIMVQWEAFMHTGWLTGVQEKDAVCGVTPPRGVWGMFPQNINALKLLLVASGALKTGN